ncbi:hypothetical protein JTB14_014362 [Gonioctena quinquepunctata]|nr:hypothetical protein JTB14_014362 [Gonioctena quinquepunctata]
MNCTPQSCSNSADSGCYFDTSHSLYESTPNSKVENESVFLSNISRKRKASCLDNFNARKLSEVIESYPPSPQFSSTLNESLMNNLQNFHLKNISTICHEKGQSDSPDFEQSEHNDDSVFYSNKIFRSNDSIRKYWSAPNTPEKPIKTITHKANTSSFIKNFSQINVQSQSPLNKDAYDILYPNIPSLDPSKKHLTPQKIKCGLDKIITPTKKRLHSLPRKELFRKIVTNNIIMERILAQLSNGDLYRLGQVSTSLKDAILLDPKASTRYLGYLRVHHNHKENYRITPPSSPEQVDEFQNEASPNSKNFVYFYKIASELNKNQSLTKCPRCGKASVVDNSIGQCQDLNRCGYIFCKKCDSFAINPKDFRDKCNNAQILDTTKTRNQLGDLSNSSITSDYMTEYSTFFSSSLNLNLSSKCNFSGTIPEVQMSTPKLAVKRNLSKSFMLSSEMKNKVLSINNNNVTTPTKKSQRRTSLLPVLPSEDAKKPHEIMEPSSPPKIKLHSVGSKQSKRNLKRLTR